MKYHQGFYKPKNPQKYEGDPTKIIYRSSWELKFLNWCDRSDNILAYSSEEVVIPYRCATDNKLHRYFVDFKIKIKSTDGTVKTYLVEVKPASQTQAPKYTGKKTKRYLTEALTFMKNQSKWDAAEEYCKSRGWLFKVITEYDLGIAKRTS